MNVLNGVAERHPGAISLAAGRPAAESARLDGLDAAVARFLAGSGRSEIALWQYGATPGLLPERVAELLAHDEGIAVEPGEVVMSTGAQEAMFLMLAALFEPGRDVLLVPDPTYVGITGAAALAGVPVAPIDSESMTPSAIEGAVDALAARGLRARGLYLVPDFQNPLGSTIPIESRRALLAVAAARDLWIIEDSPYRLFAFDAPPPPTLATLDERGGRVVHLGTFAKALCPGLRLGFLAWPGAPAGVIARLLQAKSFVTVNTSPITQAIADGVLRARCGDGPPSLRVAAGEAIAIHRARRDALCAALGDALPKLPGLTFTRPAGGFFVRVDLPFEVDAAALDRCAAEHRVLFCPMSMFSPTGGWRRTARLSFSAAPPDVLAEGARRFAAFVAEAGR
ncbi:MAG: PLP-dependent aminotransferase family protein [bacterium]